MKRKEEQRKTARELRLNGLSMNKIAEKVGVSKSSISYWVRDIILSDEQKEVLYSKQNNGRQNFIEAQKQCVLNCKMNRLKCQNEGKNKIDVFVGINRDLLLCGSMLYWAEGQKRNNKNVVNFSNSDVNMLVLFLNFLFKCFSVKREEIRLSINCYNDLRSVEETEKYWLEKLNLPIECLKKTTVKKSNLNNPKKFYNYFGTCKLAVHRTDVLQQIYGIIQKIGCFEQNEFLTGISK